MLTRHLRRSSGFRTGALRPDVRLYVGENGMGLFADSHRLSHMHLRIIDTAVAFITALPSFPVQLANCSQYGLHTAVGDWQRVHSFALLTESFGQGAFFADPDFQITLPLTPAPAGKLVATTDIPLRASSPLALIAPY